MANVAVIKERMTQQKMDYETDLGRTMREHETNVLTLLNQMYNSDSGSELQHDVYVTKEIIDKMLGSEKALEKGLTRNEKMVCLEDEVSKLRAEVVTLKSGGSSKVFQPASSVPARPSSVKKESRRVTIGGAKKELET